MTDAELHSTWVSLRATVLPMVGTWRHYSGHTVVVLGPAFIHTPAGLVPGVRYLHDGVEAVRALVEWGEVVGNIPRYTRTAT